MTSLLETMSANSNRASEACILTLGRTIPRMEFSAINLGSDDATESGSVRET